MYDTDVYCINTLN